MVRIQEEKRTQRRGFGVVSLESLENNMVMDCRVNMSLFNGYRKKSEANIYVLSWEQQEENQLKFSQK